MKSFFTRGALGFCWGALAVGISFFGGVARAESLEFEWARTYRVDPAKFNQALKVVKVADGIVVGGTSASSAGESDYVVAKYKANGEEAWIRRYNGGEGNDDVLRDLTTDPNGNVLVTGTSHTVKYDVNGVLLWTNLIGGRALIADSKYVYITGFSDTDFATVQLTNNQTDGHQLWQRTFGNPDVDISYVLGFTMSGDVIVAGAETVAGAYPIVGIAVGAIRYSADGTQQWHKRDTSEVVFGGLDATRGVISMAIDPTALIHVFSRLSEVTLTSFNLNGELINSGPADFQFPGKMRLGLQGKVVMNGSYNNVRTAVIEQVDLINRSVWKRTFIVGEGRPTETTGLAISTEGDIYSAGYGTRTDGLKDLLLLRYRDDGTFVSSSLYDGVSHQNDVGVDVIVDDVGNVYVTGYSTTAEGGSEFLTVKYHQGPKIKAQPSGAMHIEFPGTPGTQYALEATSDFFDWENIATNSADINGIVQYDDNPQAPYRFYRTRQ